jgi:hypothetical protein
MNGKPALEPGVEDSKRSTYSSSTDGACVGSFVGCSSQIMAVRSGSTCTPGEARTRRRDPDLMEGHEI